LLFARFRPSFHRITERSSFLGNPYAAGRILIQSDRGKALYFAEAPRIRVKLIPEAQFPRMSLLGKIVKLEAKAVPWRKFFDYGMSACTGVSCPPE
jgi:hypothetical protein